MDSRELSEWMAYDRINISQDWYRTARLCVTIASCLSSSKRTPKLEDFLPARSRPAESGSAIFAKIRAFAASRGCLVEGEA